MRYELGKMVLSGAVAGFIAAGMPAPVTAEADNWSTIREMLFADRPVLDGSERLQLEAPARALDAAMVPMTVTLVPGSVTTEDPIRRLWLVIDNNPAPVAAAIELSGQVPLERIETRVRVNEYTPVHAVAETESGLLFAVERFVKAAGGCSAPGLKDKELAMARLGRMKFDLLTPFEAGTLQRARLKIGHPNYTGLQIDQLTRNWIPPDYVTRIEVSHAGRLVFAVDGDISLSEDPTFVFDFVPAVPGPVEVIVEDSSGRRFENRWQAGPAA